MYSHKAFSGFVIARSNGFHGPCNGFFASVGGRVSACSVLANRVDRVLGFFSSVLIGTPQPLTRKCVCIPPLVWGGGGKHLLAGEGGGSQFRRGDRHCGTLYFVS
jgi:hypothetical protein